MSAVATAVYDDAVRRLATVEAVNEQLRQRLGLGEDEHERLVRELSRVEAERDALREENDRLRMKIGFSEDVTRQFEIMKDAAVAEVARLRELVSTGLDLCVRGRVIDQAEQMPPLWITDSYHRELAEWEERTRAALAPAAETPDA